LPDPNGRTKAVPSSATRDARHLYAVVRFDGLSEGSDPTESFVLTRGYWDEADAQTQAERLNSCAKGETRYYVLPVRVSDERLSAKLS